MAMLVYQSVYFLEGQFLVSLYCFESIWPSPTACAAWLKADQLLEKQSHGIIVGGVFTIFVVDFFW